MGFKNTGVETTWKAIENPTFITLKLLWCTKTMNKNTYDFRSLEVACVKHSEFTPVILFFKLLISFLKCFCIKVLDRVSLMVTWAFHHKGLINNVAWELEFFSWLHELFIIRVNNQRCVGVSCHGVVSALNETLSKP